MLNRRRRRREYVIEITKRTTKGKPVALVVPVDGETLEEELRVYTQVRAQVAVERMQKAAKAAGRDSMALDKIDGLIT